MKRRYLLQWVMGLCFASVAAAQAPAPPAPAVSGIQGVKQEAVESVKKVEPPTLVPPPPPLAIPPPPPPASAAPQGVNKVNGVETIEGVKASGRTAIVPPPPPPPAPAGSAAPVGGDAVGGVSTIEAVKGVSGLNAVKRQNLEAALILKEGADTPAGTGAENGGKGKAAAAALLSAPLEKAPPAPGPKEDGRNGFQEFEKLTTNGS